MKWKSEPSIKSKNEELKFWEAFLFPLFWPMKTFNINIFFYVWGMIDDFCVL